MGGLVGFTTMTVRANGKTTRCFAVQTADGDRIDISFPYAVRRIKNARTASLTPQGLRDFRNAARVAIASQTMAYRGAALTTPNVPCALTGVPLTASNCAVDHDSPTFDELLFDFCLKHGVNPLNVKVSSVNGVQAQISDPMLVDAWRD